MTSLDPAAVLEALIAGNRRFSTGASRHPRRDPARREEVSGGQHPVAAIVTCSDSRVSPEIVFDQGLGDLFVVRTAGNLLDTLGLASLEYAAEHLGVPLVVVMGHSRCGAVRAAAERGHAPAHLGVIVSALAPSIDRGQRLPGDPLENAARDNVVSAVAMLQSPGGVLAGLAGRGMLRVVGMFYDVERGTVERIA